MQKKSKMKLGLVLILICLITLLISCKSIPKKIDTAFPSPIVDGVAVVTYDEITDKVTMPLWYWLKITDYVIDTEED